MVEVSLQALYNAGIVVTGFLWGLLATSQNPIALTGVISPQLTIAGGQTIVASPLVTVTIDPGDFTPVEMAFSHDESPFSSWEPFQSARIWPMSDPETAYQAYLMTLNEGRAFCDWDNEFGSLAWGESYILDSLLDMYEVTKKTIYLQKFSEHADAVISQGNDNANRPDYRGLLLPGWSASSYLTLADTMYRDTSGQPGLLVSGRSSLRQNQVSVRLTETTTITGTLWQLDVHRSLAGRAGIVFSDTTLLLNEPNWNFKTWPSAFNPGDAVVYDIYYPWFYVSEIRLYGVNGNDVQANDFELYVAMYDAQGEYTSIVTFTLQTLVDYGQSVIAFRDFRQQGRYWKVRYVGDAPLQLAPESGVLIRLYEDPSPPRSERFNAPDWEVLAAQVGRNSALVKLQSIGMQRSLDLTGDWQFLAPQRYRMALHTGMIAFPLLRFALLIENENLAEWRIKAQSYLEYARSTVNSHQDEWRSISTTRGFYVFREDAPVWANGVNLPFNQQAVMGKSLLLLYDLTGEETYRIQAMQIAQVLRDGMIYDIETDSYKWHYWFGEGYDGWKNVEGRFIPTYGGYKSAESITYASIDIDFVLLAHRHRIVFSVYDIVRLSNTFLRHLTTADGRLCFRVDDQVIEGSCSNYYVDNPLKVTEYLGLTEVVPAVYQRMEMVRPFSTALGSVGSGRKPYFLSQTLYHAQWRLTPRSGQHKICVQLQDAQGFISGPWCDEVVLTITPNGCPLFRSLTSALGCGEITFNLYQYYLPIIVR